ncbi:hypothetical protein PSENEW3n2_00000871 [Picochlorum sp. SENEW3]|nr:hypothetical protein PSENEW3n2_00000871 [Picochlorum sp. SENEW3]WPT15793.1 hypothetical protein PSENEW3_00000871 [Picochlorum sp. SENEW3]
MPSSCQRSQDSSDDQSTLVQSFAKFSLIKRVGQKFTHQQKTPGARSTRTPEEEVPMSQIYSNLTDNDFRTGEVRKFRETGKTVLIVRLESQNVRPLWDRLERALVGPPLNGRIDLCDKTWEVTVGRHIADKANMENYEIRLKETEPCIYPNIDRQKRAQIKLHVTKCREDAVRLVGEDMIRRV